MKFLLVLLFSIVSLSLWSQKGVKNNADSVNLENVVVTHSKITIESFNTAKPLQIIAREALNRSSGSDISQILNDASGIDVAGSLSNPGKDKSVFVRGASGEFTLILIDGQPILDPSGIGGVADLRSIPISNIERIEILKGSQSTTYGSDAIAGVINIVTNSPDDKDGILANGQIGYGSYNSQFANASIKGKSGNINYRLGLNGERSDGISEALSPDPSTEFEKDEMQRFGLSGGLGYQLSNKLKFSAFGQYTDYEGDTDADSFTDSEGNRYSTELLNLGGSFEYESNSWTGALRYTLTSTDRNFDSDFGAFPFMGRFHNIDLFASNRLSESVKFILGYNYQSHGMLDEFAAVPDPSNSISSPYLSFLFSFGEYTNMEAGLRYNDHSTFGSNTNYSLAASHWISDNIKVFANHSTGFKAPNLFQLYGAFGANPDLDPQKSRSLEIGIQTPKNNNFLNPQITFFTRNVENLIAFVSSYENFAEQNDRGFEIEWGFEILEDLSLGVLYTFLDGEIKTNNSDEGMANLFRRPKHNFGIKGFYDLNEKIHINAGIRSVGERQDIFFNPANGFQSEEVTLDSYIYGTLHVDYEISEKISAFLDLKNITDSNFQEIYGFSTPGINFMFGVNWRLE
jgi:vitamin B12 transporter